MSTTFTVAAYEPLPRDWREWTERKLGDAGLPHMRLRNGVFVPGERRTLRGVTYADGTLLTRLWIGPRRWGLGAQTRRSYFEPASDRIDNRPEYTIVGKSRPPKPPVSTQIRAIQDVLVRVARDTRMAPVRAEPAPLEQHNPPNILVGNETLPAAGTFNNVYRANGFDTVPTKWLISVCPVERTPYAAAVTLCRKLERVAGQRGCTLKVQIVDEALIRTSLAEIDRTGSRRSGKTILFLLPQKGQSPSPSTLTLLRALDSRGITYRRAYANDPFEFSVPDQLPSLLMASGGQPHRVQIKRDGEPTWSVGIDLSHRAEETTSTLATTVIDPNGVLVGTWLSRHRKNEKPDEVALAKMMMRAADRAASLGAANDPVLIMRDGRMFEGESFQLYEQAFEGPTTVIEYRKGQNPPILRGPDPAPTPGAYLVSDENTLFLSTMAPRKSDDLPSVAKVTWRRNWNQAMFSPTHLADALISLALAPGLGMHRREKPAPIYWADGIAGIAADDLRFAGNAPNWLDVDVG